MNGVYVLEVLLFCSGLPLKLSINYYYSFTGDYGLARVAVVDEELKCVYHTFVKPKLKIVDYLTKYSGITPALLKKVETTEQDVRRDLQKLLPPDAIIVGQTVSSDLVALKVRSIN